MNRGPRDRATNEHHYVEERLSAYLDGRLSSREQRVVEHHLARCPACRWNLRTLRQTVQWTRELPTVPAPRAFTLPVAPRARVVPQPRRSWLPVLQGATALVALLLVFVVAGDLLLLGLLPASAPRPVAVPEQPAAAMQVTEEVARLKEAGPPPSEEVEKAVASPTPFLLRQPATAPEPPPQGTVEAEAAIPRSGVPSTTTIEESITELVVVEPLSLTVTSTAEVWGLGGAISEPQPMEGPATALAAPVTEPVILPTLDMAMARSWTTETVPLTLPLPATLPETVPSFTTPVPDVYELVPAAETREGAVISASIGISPTVEVEAPAVGPSPTVEAEALAVVPSPTVEIKTPLSARAPLALPPQPTAAPTQVEERPSTPTALAAASQPVLPTPVGQVVQEAGPAREDSERAALALERTSLVGWLRAAEIGLGTLFIVLAMVTLVLMIGRRQAR